MIHAQEKRKVFIRANEKKFRHLGYRFKFADKSLHNEDDLWVEPIELGIKQDDVILPRDKEVEFVVGKDRILVVLDSIWNMSKFWWIDKLYVLFLIFIQIGLYIIGFKIFVK